VGQARSTVVTVCGADLQFPSPQNSASANATENFDTYRNLQPHRAVLPAIAWHLVIVFSRLQIQISLLPLALDQSFTALQTDMSVM